MDSVAIVIIGCLFIYAVVLSILFQRVVKTKDELVDGNKQLQRENRELKLVNVQYKNQVTELITEVEVLTDISEKIPEGCTKGPWCKGCDFVKKFYVPTGSVGIHSAYTHRECYACGKGVSCANYVGHTEEK